MQKKSANFSNLSLEEMKVPVTIGGIQTFALVGHERVDNDDENEIADNYTVSIQHPEFGTNHFKIVMDEGDNIVTVDKPEWVDDQSINDILLALTTPHK